MPLYAFTCGVCGPFEVRRSISRLGEPVSCPTCAGPGKRVFTPPGVRQVSAPLRRAKDLEEKSAELIIPAKLDPEETKRAQDIGRKAFTVLECEGMARVDLFLDRTSGEFFFNELNTIPGFTSISMYPKLWEASGIGYQELLSKLVDLAISRHEKKKTLVREFRIEK